MKKRKAVLVGIIAMMAVITSVGLTAMLERPDPMIPKPIKRFPGGRTKYFTSKPGDEYKTMLPGAVFRPVPKKVGYIITGEAISIKQPGDTRRMVVMGRNLIASPISHVQLEQLKEATSATVPLEVKKTESIILQPGRPAAPSFE